MSFPKVPAGTEPRELQGARHRTRAGGAVAVSRETTPATGEPGVASEGRQIPPRGPVAAFSGASLLKASPPLRPVGLEANSGSSADSDQMAVAGGYPADMSVTECPFVRAHRAPMRVCRSQLQGHRTQTHR